MTYRKVIHWRKWDRSYDS